MFSQDEMRQMNTMGRTTEARARDAGVFTSRGIGELRSAVSELAAEGFRIIIVIDTQNGDYHIVAQKEDRGGNG